MWPSPRPEIIGTSPPQAATIGASSSETLSPTPPVECLSSTGPVVPLEHRRPSASSRRSARRARRRRGRGRRPPSRTPRPGRRSAPPSAIPSTMNAISSSRQARRRRACAGSAPAGSVPSSSTKRSISGPSRSAARLGDAQRLLVAELLAAHPLGEVGDRRDGRHAQARVAGGDHLGHRAHADEVGARACGTRGSRPASRSSGRRRRGRRRRAARCRARRRRRAGARAARGRRRRAGSGSAARRRRRSGPVSGLKPSRLMWSRWQTRLPGPGLRPQRAGGVGEHQHLGAERLERADRRRDRARPRSPS